MDYHAIQKKGLVSVADVDGDISGVVASADTEDDFMWLDVLAVYKKYKGQGIGGKLIEYAEKIIAESKKECRIYQ